MSTSKTNDFFNDIHYAGIIDNIKGIFTSDASMATLLDFERVLDEADMYAYKHWDLGELVDGPKIKKYTVACVFMYPEKRMPDPRAGKRLIAVGCNIKFKKTKIKVAVKVEEPDDFQPGTHFPRSIERSVWLVRIEIPKELMNDIREGSIDLAGQTIDLEDLDNAYEDDLDKEAQEGGEQPQGQPPGGQMPPQGAPMPGAAPPPGAPM
jgi:hypothetical protein